MTSLEKRLTAWVDAAKAGDVGAVDQLRAEIYRLTDQVDQVGVTAIRMTDEILYLNRMLDRRAHDDARIRIIALLDACHAAGRTWLPAADVRKALDMEE